MDIHVDMLSAASSALREPEKLPERPVRVVMVAACPFPANHGTPGAIRELSLHLARLGHEVHVVTYPEYEQLPVDGITIHRVRPPFVTPGKIQIGPSYKRLVYDFFMISQLVRVIKSNDIEIIHAHNYEGAMIGAVAKWITRKPMVYTGINSMSDELPSYRFIRPRWLAYSFGKILDFIVPRAGNVLMVLSDELKQFLQGLGIPSERIVVIPPGVDVEMFSNGDGGRIRDKHQLGMMPTVVYTGALEGFQRLDLLLKAMQSVVAKIPQAKLIIVGNIENREALDIYKKMAKDFGIETNVLFIESVPLDELQDYLAAADIAVVPRPYCPGYPIKLLNYMAAGKAIVAFEGSAKALCHGYNGYVAKGEDFADLAAGIVLLLRDSELRVTLGTRARAGIFGVYDWETLAKGTALVYDQMRDNPDSLDKTALESYLKASYVPRLTSDEGRDENGSGFLLRGAIEYESFSDRS